MSSMAFFPSPPFLFGTHRVVTPSDITSFYKEELAGQQENTVSLLARLNNRSKLQQLRIFADDVVEAHRRTSAILADREAAYGDYMLFWSGYVPFHAASKRYRLSELGIH